VRQELTDQYGAHAVRRNIANRHSWPILLSDDLNPWADAYRVTVDESGTCGEFGPEWAYLGPAKI